MNFCDTIFHVPLNNHSLLKNLNQVIPAFLDGYLLTLRQKNGYINQWHLVGGTVFYREKIIDAIARIALEEIGTKVIVKKLLGVVEYPSELKERGFGYSISLNYLCKLPQNFVLTLDDQQYRLGTKRIY